MRTKSNNSLPTTPSFTVLSFFGIYFIVCAAIIPFFSANILTVIAAFAVILLLMAFGYFMQAAFCKATGFKRELETRAYEPEYKYFKKKRAYPIWAVIFFLSIFVNKLTDLYLLEQSKKPTVVYDPDSLLPLIVAAAFFVTVALGAFVWFYPYNRIMTGAGLYAGLIVLSIIFALYSTMRAPGMEYVGLCLIGYTLCAMFSANQYALRRTYRGTVVSFMTPKTRRYNMLLSLGLVAVFLLILFAAYLIVNGVRVCVLFVLAAILRAGATTGDNDPEENVVGNISNVLWGREDVVHSANYWLFWVFVVFFFIGSALFLLRRRAEFRRFLAWLKATVVAFFEFLWLPVRDSFDHGEEYFSNYLDEEIKLQKKDISAKRRAESAAHMTWFTFSTELRAKKNEEEKYRFAYSTFVDQLRKMPTFVKKSDTPRKIRDRLSASGRVTTKHEIEMITEAFEQIEYADRPATPETEKALEALCDKIRENL